MEMVITARCGDARGHWLARSLLRIRYGFRNGLYAIE
jgi:hypothetical protein